MVKRRASQPLEGRPSKQTKYDDSGEDASEEDYRKVYMGAGLYLLTSKWDSGRMSKFQETLLGAAKKTPRFLFRMWYRKSGGKEGLNTQTAITPRGFADGHFDDTMTLFDMDIQTFVKNASAHVRYDKMQPDTVFSSWSQCLQTVFNMAQRHWKDDPHISILDTKKVDSGNVIVNTKTYHDEVDKSIHSYNDEFLAFGIIRESAFQTIQVPDFTQTLSSLDFGKKVTSRADMLQTMQALSSGLTLHYTIPLVAHSVSLGWIPRLSDQVSLPEYDVRLDILCSFWQQLTGSDKRTTAWKERMRFVKTLAEDSTIMIPARVNTFGMAEAETVVRLLYHLVQHALGGVAAAQIHLDELRRQEEASEHWKEIMSEPHDDEAVKNTPPVSVSGYKMGFAMAKASLLE